MEKIVDLPFCVSCCGVLNFARWEVPLKMTISETFEAVGKALISNHLAEDSPEFWEKLKAKTSSDFRCMCCLNVLRQEEVFQLCEEIAVGIEELDPSTTCVMLDIQIAPAIEVCRVMSRSVIKESAKPNPRFETVLEKVIAWYLQTRREIEVKPEAAMKVTVHFDMQRQMDLCLSVFPDFRPKKQRKRTFGATEDGENNKNGQGDKDEDDVSISQSNIDKVLIAIRNMSSTALPIAQPKFLTQTNSQTLARRLSVDYGTVFIYGRYWKFARDVPQSAWTISAHQEVNSHEAPASNGDDNAEPTQQVLRVGRTSITEIIETAVTRLTQARSVLLHGCGREDIDVRCLGNGRPFVLQIHAPRVPITPEILRDIEAFINDGDPHSETPFSRDIRVQHLQITTPKTWEIMQKEAEEKKKAYRCVCYSSRAISKEELYATFNSASTWDSFAKNQYEQLMREQQSNKDGSNNDDKQGSDAQLMLMDRNRVDEEGDRYLFTIQQHTPLRVMHRRVLMERRRAIYAIEAEFLNEHFFLLSLVTGAGTYVKEFVHGDLGRTQPNVATLLGNTETEILQLDVIWLYDHFDRLLLPGGEKEYEEHQQRLHQRWLHRRKLLYDHRQQLKQVKLADASNSDQAKRAKTLPCDGEEAPGEEPMDVDVVAAEPSTVAESVPVETKEEVGEWLKLPALPTPSFVKG